MNVTYCEEQIGQMYGSTCRTSELAGGATCEEGRRSASPEYKRLVKKTASFPRNVGDGRARKVIPSSACQLAVQKVQEWRTSELPQAAQEAPWRIPKASAAAGEAGDGGTSMSVHGQGGALVICEDAE